MLLVSAKLPEVEKQTLIQFLKARVGTFTWSPHDIPGIDPSVMSHSLNISNNFPPVKQRQRRFALEVNQAIQEELLDKPDLSGRLSKWAIELGTYDIRFLPQKVKKGQVLADFLVEIQSFTPETLPKLLDSEVEWMWTMHTDRGSNSQGAGIGVVLEAPSRLKVEEAIRLEQFATNNEAEYEALIYGLELAQDKGIRRLRVRGDSKLMIEQVVGNFNTKAPHLTSILEKVSELKSQFHQFELVQIPREQN
ncbi:uncharacterized protein LOC133795457 [Humulus lupulus]|uniref:uncharacterized protein LOC133795457 n=1 Tax=Humulus lupulus TaxID=3486 RepID=UPI002B417154|nr:uncharacterized protein LOC133795457 [Humulus lupulus]